MTRQEAISVLYFVNKLKLEESELGQGALLRTVSKRLCDLFVEKAKADNPKRL
jgi:hypothetical protein